MQTQMFNKENATNLNEVSIPLLTEQMGQYWKFTSLISAEKRETYEQRVFSLISKFAVQEQAEVEILDPKKNNTFMNSLRDSVNGSVQRLLHARQSSIDPVKDAPLTLNDFPPSSLVRRNQSVFSPHAEMVERTPGTKYAMDSVTCDVLILAVGINHFDRIRGTSVFNDLLSHLVAEHGVDGVMELPLLEEAKIDPLFFVLDGVDIALSYRSIKKMLADGTFSLQDLSELEKDIVLLILDGYTQIIAEDISVGEHSIHGRTLLLPTEEERKQSLGEGGSLYHNSYPRIQTREVLTNGMELLNLKERVVSIINARRIVWSIDKALTEFVQNFTEVVNDLKNEASK